MGHWVVNTVWQIAVFCLLSLLTYQTHRCFLWQRSKADERFPVHQGARKFGAMGMKSTALVLPKKISGSDKLQGFMS